MASVSALSCSRVEGGSSFLAPSGVRLRGAAGGLPALVCRSPRAPVRARLSAENDSHTTGKWLPEALTPSLSGAAALLAAGALFFAPLAVDFPTAEAAQSSGRVGGSAGFSRSRSAPPPPSRVQSRTTIVSPNITVVPPSPFGGFLAPPPLFGGWGFSPFGYGFGPSVVVAGPNIFGFFFNAFLFLVVASIVVSVITNIFRRD